MTSLPISLPNNSRAIAFAIAAIFCFSCMDVCVKYISPITGTLPALWARYTVQMMIVLILVAPRLRTVVRTRYPKLQITRSLLLMSATFFFFMALGRIGLAEATAVMSINPMLITIGGALFLGEALGQRRITAIVIALIGALIVIRPGSDVFSPLALLPLGSATCFTAYTLITRRIGSDEDVWTSLFYTGLVGTIVLSAVVPFYWQPLPPKAIIIMLMIGAFGATGQMLLIRALTMAEAGLVAPFNYCGLVFSIGFGLILFAEVPDLWTIVGALVIVGAGIYVWHREMRVAKVAR